MNYTIRTFEERDFDQVIDILTHSFHKKFKKLFKYDEDEMTQFLKDINFFESKPRPGYFVAADGDYIFGVMSLKWRGLKTEKEHFEFLKLVRKYGNRKIVKTIITAITMVDIFDKGECYIEHVAISKEARGQGIGTALIHYGDQYAIDNKFTKYTLHVATTNEGALKLYENLGFNARRYVKSRILKWLLDEKTFVYMSKKPGDDNRFLNIGMFTDTYMPQINGVATSINILARTLEEMGHTVHIITINKALKTTYEDNILRIPGVKVLKGTDYKLANILISDKTERIIEEMHLDVIHTHTEFSLGLLGTYISRKYNIPQVHTYHTMYDDCMHYVTNFKPFQRLGIEILKKYIREFTEECQTIVVPTDKTKEVLIDYKVDTDIKIIPTGIDFGQFSIDEDHSRITEIKDELSIATDDFVVLNIGRLSKEKNTGSIVEAVKKLIPNNPRIKLVVIGDGPEMKNLQKSIQGFENNIKLIGRVPWEQIGYYYHIGHTFVTASRFETQGLTVIEALSSGIPVICTNDKAFLDIIEDGYNGMLFESDDLIGDKILKMMDIDTFMKLQYNTQKSVQKYSSEFFAETMLDEYEHVIKQVKI